MFLNIIFNHSWLFLNKLFGIYLFCIWLYSTITVTVIISFGSVRVIILYCIQTTTITSIWYSSLLTIVICMLYVIGNL